MNALQKLRTLTAAPREAVSGRVVAASARGVSVATSGGVKPYPADGTRYAVGESVRLTPSGIRSQRRSAGRLPTIWV